MKKNSLPLLIVIAFALLAASCGDNGRTAAIDKAVKGGMAKADAIALVDKAIADEMQNNGKSKKDAEKAVLAGIDGLIAPNSGPEVAAVIAETAAMADADYYGDLGDIQYTTAEDSPRAVILKLSIGYKKGNADVAKEFVDRNYDIAELMRQYFSSKKAADFDAKNQPTLKTEIKDKLNEFLANKAVIDVRFDTLRLVKF